MLYGNIEQLTLLPYVNNIIKKLIIEAVKIAEDQPAGRYDTFFPGIISYDKRRRNTLFVKPQS